MNDGLHGADPRVTEKGKERRPDHRFPSDVSILLRHLAADAVTASARDDDSRNPCRHESNSAHVSGIALAHVQRRGLVPPKPRICFYFQIHRPSMQNTSKGSILHCNTCAGRSFG
jgi:hypothetical protein